MIDYPKRLEDVRHSMAREGIGLMYLAAGANLTYLTGVPRKDDYRTDHNRYGDYIVGGYIGLEEGVTLIAARMGGQRFQDSAEGKPWFDAVRLIMESEDPKDVLLQVLSRFGLERQKIAMDDRAWAQSLLAFREALPENQFVLASEILAPMRMVKEPEALDLMRRAGKITDQVWQAVLEKLRRGVSEFDVEAEVDYQFRLLGAAYNSFPTAVCFSGPGHADEPSDMPATQRSLKARDAITVDFGCVYEGYCSDFGRSAFVGEPPREYLRIHELVLQAQHDAMTAMKPGQVTAAQVNAAGRAPIEAAGYGPCFTHRLGHGIGLTVHEEPFLDAMDDTVIQENMTFTVEPSIRSVSERPILGGYANRVEDVVVVTEDGGESMYDTSHELRIIG